MSKYQAIRTIRAEIDRLNREIDLRIIKGISYKRESARHKFLMATLVRLQPRKINWFERSFSFMASIVL